MIRPHVFNGRLAYPVPVFERCFQVALNEIDGAKEVVSIGILGIESKGEAQIAARFCRMLLLECDARQLDGKSFVVSSEPFSGAERDTRIIEASDLGQRASVHVLEVGRLVGDRLDFADDFCPALFGCELLEMLGLWRVRVGCVGALTPTERNERHPQEESNANWDAGKRVYFQIARLWPET